MIRANLQQKKHIVYVNKKEILIRRWTRDSGLGVQATAVHWQAQSGEGE